MRCKTRCIGKGFLVLLGVGLLSGLVMVLWNWLIPDLFVGAKTLDYLLAMGLLVLCRLLFGGFRGHCHRHGGMRHWMKMSPEEREQFKNGLHKCCPPHHEEH